jgi:hypothetical protein
MPRYNSQRQGTASTVPKLTVLFCVLFVCKCVLYCCHRVATQLQLTNISYHINGKAFGKKVTEYKMCVLIFSTTFVWNISHSAKNSARYFHKCTSLGLHVKYRLFLYRLFLYRLFCQVLFKLGFSRQIFEIWSNIKFYENSSSASRVVQCGRTDGWTERHDKSVSRFSQFWGKRLNKRTVTEDDQLEELKHVGKMTFWKI